MHSGRVPATTSTLLFGFSLCGMGGRMRIAPESARACPATIAAQERATSAKLSDSWLKRRRGLCRAFTGKTDLTWSAGASRRPSAVYLASQWRQYAFLYPPFLIPLARNRRCRMIQPLAIAAGSIPISHCVWIIARFSTARRFFPCDIVSHECCNLAFERSPSFVIAPYKKSSSRQHPHGRAAMAHPRVSPGSSRAIALRQIRRARRRALRPVSNWD